MSLQGLMALLGHVTPEIDSSLCDAREPNPAGRLRRCDWQTPTSPGNRPSRAPGDAGEGAMARLGVPQNPGSDGVVLPTPGG